MSPPADRPPTSAPPAAEEPDPPEVVLGERLFVESRFSYRFYTVAGADVNHSPSVGNPVTTAHAAAADKPLPGSFAGYGMSCRHCHLVDELAGREDRIGSRAYADFATRTPIHPRSDGRTTTLRNTQQLVDLGAPNRRAGLLLHADGEFATLEDLVRATLTGRNMGWLPAEEAVAIRQVARVIRGDRGDRAHLAVTAEGPTWSGSYADVLAGRSPVAPGYGAGYVLPPAWRLDVSSASDAEIMAQVAKLIAAYVRSLELERDEAGQHSGSAYDGFLKLNGLPRAPKAGESDAAYSVRLQTLIGGLASARTYDGGSLTLHRRPKRFGAIELAGLKTFLVQCANCHPPPLFTDGLFHNTGATQLEYDGVHGEGEFEALAIPDWAARTKAPDRYLPPTAAHPDRPGPFFSRIDPKRPGRVDLGVWNVFGNPDAPKVQDRLRAALSVDGAADDPARLSRAIAAFRTPHLRNLGQSEPYLHNGAQSTLAGVIGQYRLAATLARRGELRAAGRKLAAIKLDDRQAAEIVAFLRSLDEDYE